MREQDEIVVRLGGQGTRADLARELRRVADTIDAGHLLESPDCTVRTAARGSGEEHVSTRMHLVSSSDDYDCRPSAMFSDLEDAERWARGEPVQNDNASVDQSIMRADISVSFWNSYDDDPHARG